MIKLKTKLDEVLDKKISSYYCILWPPARRIFDKILNEVENVENGISIIDSMDFSLDRENFKRFHV